MEEHHKKVKKEADSLTPIEENDHILPITDEESKTSNEGHNTSMSSTEIDVFRDNDELVLLDNLIKREETLLGKTKNVAFADSSVKKTPSFIKQTTTSSLKEAIKKETIKEEPSREASALMSIKEDPEKQNKEYEEFKQEIINEIEEEEKNKDKLDEELDKKYDYLVTRDESDDEEKKDDEEGENTNELNLPTFDNEERVLN